MNYSGKLSELISEGVIKNQEQFAQDFSSAKPFKHVVIENFFADQMLHKLIDEFPVPPPRDTLRNEFGATSNKYSCTDIRGIGGAYIIFDKIIASAAFIKLMEKITGIDGLTYDPEYIGGGTHDNFEGQGMYPHVDFNYHPTTGYHRRINAIVYLNEDWRASWGGALDLHSNPWNWRENNIKTVLPRLGTCVIFETNEHSWHGFDRIKLPHSVKRISRRSLAIYMYSKDRPQEDTRPKHATIYVQEGLDKKIKAGHTLTDEDVAKIERNFHTRNLYLKSLYNRETKFISTIQTLNRILTVYKNRYRLPLVGNVMQILLKSQPYPDGWVEKEIDFTILTLGHIDRIGVEITIPDNISYKKTVTIHIGDEKHNFAITHRKQRLLVTLKKHLSKNKKIDMRIVGEQSLSLLEAGISGDKRKISFLLREIQFYSPDSSNRRAFRLLNLWPRKT